MFIEDALKFLRQNTGKEFFLYLPLTIPHDNGEQQDSLRFEVPSQGIYAGMDWGRKEKDYAAMISRMDEGVGRIMDYLDQSGLADNTG